MMPVLNDGNSYVDDRGILHFFNDVEFDVKRIYMIENFSTNTVRAWHYHESTSKVIMVVSGSIICCVGKIIKEGEYKGMIYYESINRFVMSYELPSYLYIPSGYANGFCSLLDGTKILVLNDNTDINDEIKIDPDDIISDEEMKKGGSLFNYDKLLWKVKNR